MNDAASRRRIGEELGSALGKPQAGIRDDQLYARKSPLFEMLQEGAPACLVLLRPSQIPRISR